MQFTRLLVLIFTRTVSTPCLVLHFPPIILTGSRPYSGASNTLSEWVVKYHRRLFRKVGVKVLYEQTLLRALWLISPPQNSSNFLCWLQKPFPCPMTTIQRHSSLSAVLRQVFLDLPLFLLPSGVHDRAMLVLLFLSCLKIWPIISRNTAIEIYKALIEPHFDYCSPVWYGISSNLTNKLQKLQNRAARIIAKSDFGTRSATLRQLLEWDDLSTRRSKYLGVAMFKTLNGLFPSYLKDLFITTDPKYELRNQENKLVPPKPRTNFRKKSFSYNGARLWNSLPREMRTTVSLSKFKNDIGRHFTLSDSHGNHRKQ